MNTDQQSRNQRNLTTKTRKREEILCDSSRFRVFVVNRMRALAGERTKILCKKQRIFGLVVQMNIDPRSSVFIGGFVHTLGCGLAAPGHRVSAASSDRDQQWLPGLLPG